ncbi:MAG: SDR family NAD(P)-dependent oxidoreductase, partial [Gammaproteobacteria bacterium]|nr:SDR family NAD(P)-dependent oxidoreductase [Gammaproteobacteria bacterium]
MVTRDAAADETRGNGDGGGDGNGSGDFDFSGKTAVVTGAARGIGLAIARRFAAAAARVVVADVQPPPTPESSGAGLVFHRADVSDETQVRGLFDYAVDKFGGVDILVNNAGVAVEARLEDTAVADWERVFAVNARGVFLCAKHALRAMNRRGGRRGAERGRGGAGQNDAAETTAAIINIGSIEARAANPLHAAYAASKGAVHSFTRSVALEYGARGIRCNAVAPGWIDTPFNDAFIARQPDPRGLRAALRGLHPLGRTGAPDDIADVVLW